MHLKMAARAVPLYKIHGICAFPSFPGVRLRGAVIATWMPLCLDVYVTNVSNVSYSQMLKIQFMHLLRMEITIYRHGYVVCMSRDASTREIVAGQSLTRLNRARARSRATNSELRQATDVKNTISAFVFRAWYHPSRTGHASVIRTHTRRHTDDTQPHTCTHTHTHRHARTHALCTFRPCWICPPNLECCG